MEENNDGTNTELTVDGVDASLGESWTAVNLPPETGPSVTEPNRYSGGRVNLEQFIRRYLSNPSSVMAQAVRRDGGAPSRYGRGLQHVVVDYTIVDSIHDSWNVAYGNITLDPGLLFDAATLAELGEDQALNNQGWHPITNHKFGVVLSSMLSLCGGGWQGGGQVSDSLRRMFRYTVRGRTMSLEMLPGFQWADFYRCRVGTFQYTPYGTFQYTPYGIRSDWRDGSASITDCIVRRLQQTFGPPNGSDTRPGAGRYCYQNPHDDRITSDKFRRIITDARVASCVLGDFGRVQVRDGKFWDLRRHRLERYGHLQWEVPVISAYPVACISPRRPVLFEVMTAVLPPESNHPGWDRWRYAGYDGAADSEVPVYMYSYFAPPAPSEEFCQKFWPHGNDFEDFRTMLKDPRLDDAHRAGLVDWLLEHNIDQETADNFGVPGYARLLDLYGLEFMKTGVSK